MKIFAFIRSKLFLFLWALVYCLNIITFLVILYKISPGNKNLVLKYNILVGVEWYGKGKNLYLIPFAALCISTINAVIYKKFKNNEHFYSSLIIFVSLLVQLIFLFAIMLLTRVN